MKQTKEKARVDEIIKEILDRDSIKVHVNPHGATFIHPIDIITSTSASDIIDRYTSSNGNGNGNGNGNDNP